MLRVFWRVPYDLIREPFAATKFILVGPRPVLTRWWYDTDFRPRVDEKLDTRRGVLDVEEK